MQIKKKMKIQKVIACLIKVGRFTPMGRFISITGDGQEFNAQWLGSNFSNTKYSFSIQKNKCSGKHPLI